MFENEGLGLEKVTSVAEDRAELKPGTVALRVRRADYSVTLSPKSKKVNLRASFPFRVASEVSRERTGELVDLSHSRLLSRAVLA